MTQNETPTIRGGDGRRTRRLRRRRRWDIVAVIATGGALVAALLAVQLGVLLADQLGYHREAGLSRPPKHRNNVLFGSGGEVSGGYRA